MAALLVGQSFEHGPLGLGHVWTTRRSFSSLCRDTNAAESSLSSILVTSGPGAAKCRPSSLQPAPDPDRRSITTSSSNCAAVSPNGSRARDRDRSTCAAAARSAYTVLATQAAVVLVASSLGMEFISPLNLSLQRVLSRNTMSAATKGAAGGIHCTPARGRRGLAPSPSGKAGDCKSPTVGSIPTGASRTRPNSPLPSSGGGLSCFPGASPRASFGGTRAHQFQICRAACAVRPPPAPHRVAGPPAA